MIFIHHLLIEFELFSNLDDNIIEYFANVTKETFQRNSPAYFFGGKLILSRSVLKKFFSYTFLKSFKKFCAFKSKKNCCNIYERIFFASKLCIII